MKRHFTFTDIIILIFFLLYSLTVLFPITWVAYTSIKTNKEFVANPWALGKSLEFINYKNAWKNVKFGMYAFNSIIITAISVITTILLSAMLAYPLSRFQFKTKGIIYIYMIAGLYIPVTILLAPQYLLLSQFRIIDTRIGLILIYVAINIPYSILILTGFYSGIPREIEESAEIDGLNYYGQFWRIIFPLTKNGLLTVGIFNFIYIWNDYVFALTFLNTPQKRTLPVGIIGLMESFRLKADWVTLFAGLCIVMVPSITIFLIFQSRFEKNITAGSIK